MFCKDFIESNVIPLKISLFKFNNLIKIIIICSINTISDRYIDMPFICTIYKLYLNIIFGPSSFDIVNIFQYKIIFNRGPPIKRFLTSIESITAATPNKNTNTIFNPYRMNYFYTQIPLTQR